MLLHTIYPSHVFTHFSDPSPTLRKSENVSSILNNIPTHIKKNRSNLNSIFTIKCFQKSTQEEEEAAKDKKLALAEWLSSTKKAAGDTSSSPAPPFKSTGTPSAPSRPNINSKYSPFSPSTPRSHDRPPKPSKIRDPASWRPRNPNPKAAASATLEDDGREVVFGDNGLAYRLAEAPFEFQYSYTETPKVKPLALREAAFVPFGPTTMPRPWTGRAPLPPSKKKPREFDSFKLPPPNKKGVKHIQLPGPFLKGQGPKYVKTREEVLGERLTREEVKQLVQSSCHGSRQLNIGRDGLTHNMLENIHDHWKRRRVCKIKCKGVATVDMDNICNQLEDKTGGKVIHRAGGAVYLFRGRNYNYKTRPVFPMMLWKPVSAVYPRLIERAPGGLTIEEANEFRKKGRSLLPVCKLAKNGVYWDLVKDVRDAFEVCDLARIDCRGLNPSDYRKIGAKLKDLVPCVLLSFELEHILMWRGKDWKPNEAGVEALEAHSDRECSVADSVKDTTRYTLMTALPIDEKSASEHPVSEYALTKENVLESNSMASENIAHEVLGDKDRITTDLEKSSELQCLVKNADDTMVVKLLSEYALAKENVLESNFMPSRNVADEALGDKDRITTDLEKSTGLRRLLKNADDTKVVKLVSEYATDKENVLESNNMPSENVSDDVLGDKDRITTNLEKSARLQRLVKNADDTNGGEVGSLEDKLGMSRSLEVELEELIESNEKIFSDGELTSDVSVSATNRDPQCLVEDSDNNSQTSSSSNVELEEIVESKEATVFSNGGGDLSVSVLAINTDDQCLGEDSAYNSRASDVPFFNGGEDAAISALKQLSEDVDALFKTVDDVSYHHADLTSDSSKRLTDSFFTAAETSMVDEELVKSTDKDSNLYSHEESRLCAETQYAEETNGQENDDKFIDTDGNEFIAHTTSETSQRGVGFHIDVLWAQAIDSGRVLLLDKSALDPDIIHEKAISFAKNAPVGPFFKRRFSQKKVVKKPWKKKSLVKINESEGQKSAQRNLNNGRGEISHSSDDLAGGGLPIDELARLLAQ